MSRCYIAILLINCWVMVVMPINLVFQIYDLNRVFTVSSTNTICYNLFGLNVIHICRVGLFLSTIWDNVNFIALPSLFCCYIWYTCYSLCTRYSFLNHVGRTYYFPHTSTLSRLRGVHSCELERKAHSFVKLYHSFICS